ncbi:MULTISPECIES: hypothetical protein [Turicibacter]|uniref:Uncharacterized protein n=1 Tax=Turicibacter sanguinis TaxID=154288 RepID=A0A9X5APV8_9FIRM|nr:MULTISPECIES: hypothetical protein [Turicibacter]EGC93426.1 conserved domain protein [Turicibacter sp. HGF1]MBP3902746.1 hypothetical protein [Turicibacter sp.]MCU7191535.1 hypothetical protein [Turicibacter sanguinis]MCU7212293.1 hypothetical protein [Turicibacter sanguinis]MDB8436428.1 hypothetical protein [Turicibacter sanguinis]
MKCLICKNLIVINSFSMVFAHVEPKLCQRCHEQMIPNKLIAFPLQMYEDNEFMRELIRRLNLGDFVLLEVILPTLHQGLLKFKSDIKELIAYDVDDQLSEILLEALQFKGEGGKTIKITSMIPEKIEQEGFISIL